MTHDSRHVNRLSKSFGLPEYMIYALFIALVISWNWLGAVHAEPPQIEVSVGSEEVFVGETIDFQVDVRNVENPSPPDLSALAEQFDVEFAGDQSRNQSSTMIINGRVSQSSRLSHLFLYKLRPKVSGSLTIPPVTASVDGNKLSSRSLNVKVLDIEQQDFVIAETICSDAEVFPTQSFDVTLRILVQPIPGTSVEPLNPLRRRPPHLQVDWIDPPEGLSAENKSEWLNSLLSRSGVGFSLNEYSTQSGSIFDSPRVATFDLYSGREKRKDADGNDVEYFVYELKRSFTANRIGTYRFGPSTVKGTFVVGREGTEYLGKKIVTMAAAREVTVKEVPSPRPATYSGGIGEYRLKASASPTNLRVGDPLTLNLEFSPGSKAGTLDLLSAPDLSAIPEIADNFDIIDSKPTGRVDGKTKKFGYAIRPKKSGVSIPPLSIATFDPVAQTFVETTSDPIPLTVLDAATINTADLVGATAKTSANSMRQSAKGIFQNIQDPRQLRDERTSWVTGIAMVAGAWSVVGIALGALTIVRRKSSDTVKVRRQRATRNALARLQEANRSSDPKNTMRGVRSAILGLIADATDRIQDGLTSADVRTALEQAKMDSVDRDALMNLMSQLESAEYGSADAVDARGMVQVATRMVQRIGPALERSRR